MSLLGKIIVAAGVDWRFRIKPAIIKYMQKRHGPTMPHVHLHGSFQS